MGSHVLAFLGVSVVVVLTPGPDMATVTRNALSHGRRGALLTMLGICSALLVHGTAAAIGLSALLRTASMLYTAVKLAGAAYLVYLGVRSLLAGRQARSGDAPVEGRQRGSPYVQGFLSALLNPKLAVFFVTFLPQFIDARVAVLPQMLLFVAIFEALALAWLTLYGLLVTSLRSVFLSPRVRVRMERVTGVVLVGLGARLALERA